MTGRRGPLRAAAAALAAVLLALTLATTLAACGKKGPLQPPPGTTEQPPRKYPHD